MTSSSSSSTPHPSKPPCSSKQARMREKAEEINLVLLEPDVDLWKLRELALSEGGLVNDTIRRRAWPKLVGLTSYNNNNPDDIHERKVISVTSPPRKPQKNPRKGTAPDRVTNFGEADNKPGTAFTGGPFDQHDTAAATADPDDNSSSDDESILSSHVVACLDSEQIERDVTRCTWHLLTGGQRSRRRLMLNKHRKKISRILRRKQRRLGDLINLTLAVSEIDLPLDERLCYYQGFHDVASIFLAALGGASTKCIQEEQQQKATSVGSATGSEAAAQAASMGLELSSKVLYQVSLSHFREPMRSNFLHLQTALRMTLLPLLRAMDPEVHAHLYACGMEPFFALSWMLTWFAHDIRDTTVVKRLFDFFLCSHQLMPIYLSVAMLCHPSNRQEVLATPCEFAELHSVCAGLPKNSSMVGWKYRVGDGYVSDDSQVGEDGETSISLDSDMASHQSGGQSSTNRGQSLLSGSDGILRRDDLILSEDHEHVISNGIPAHVPFQQLIDMAINFMGRVPPRKLYALANRYFDPQQAEPMLGMYPAITLFHSPPSWALVGTAKADWVLKQRARERIGLTATSRKDRRALSELRRRHNATTTAPSSENIDISQADESSEASNVEESQSCTPEVVEKTAKKLKWPKAMVAQGFGPGEEEVVRQRKRRKLLLIGGAATVAVFAIAIGLSFTYGGKPSQTPDAPPSDNDFLVTRKEAASYVKSTGSPARAPKKMSTDSTTINNVPLQDSCADREESTAVVGFTSEASISTVAKPALNEAAKDSLVKGHVKRIVAKQLQRIYAKVQLLVRTVEFLRNSLTDPALRHNLHRIVSGSLARVSRTLNPELLVNLQTAVTNRAVHVSRNLGHYAKNSLRLTFQLAKEHLGGDNLEEVELGA